MTGARGMLGTDLICLLEENEHEVFATDIQELDITRKESLHEMVGAIFPDAIINCAAYTNVDKAEEEPDKAFRINGLAVRNLALVCRDLGIDLCHISTDYVFDGEKNGAYVPDDPPHPINTYGASKLAGENHIREILTKFYIVRTSWLYGKYGKNFVYTILRLAKEKKELKVVDDQIGSPTWTVTLSRVIERLIRTKKFGIYHATDQTENGISWYDFAKEIVGLLGLRAEIIPIKTKDFPRPARRPLNSLFDLTVVESILDQKLPTWKDSLRTFLQSFP